MGFKYSMKNVAQEHERHLRVDAHHHGFCASTRIAHTGVRQHVISIEEFESASMECAAGVQLECVVRWAQHAERSHTCSLR